MKKNDCNYCGLIVGRRHIKSNSKNVSYNAGVQNDLLNMLYIENNNAEVAVKVNNNLSKRISARISMGKFKVHNHDGH